ncbi:sigma 54-interacting transcriptional regulator [Vibrio sp.]|nr:sigma 54-interacting transcriptional regulator [Vibrio sp.]
MRLEVSCEDRLGLTHELLDILASDNINLKDIELDHKRGMLYIHCPEVCFDEFSKLMAKIRLINGVQDVRKVPYTPLERKNAELFSIVDTLPSATLSLDLNGCIANYNQAAQILLAPLFSVDDLTGLSLADIFDDFPSLDPIMHDLCGFQATVSRQNVSFLARIRPIFISLDESQKRLSSIVITIEHQNLDTDTIKIESGDTLGFEAFTAFSSSFEQCIKKAQHLSLLEQPLLITGETGVGKEAIARACHYRSKRATKPFLILSCASIPDDAVETELFGRSSTSQYEQDSLGIFEQANGGTVFLDEIGEMSAHLQIKLLRFLQDGTFRRVGEANEVHVDVRIIAATRHDLYKLSTERTFREDLYYRLNVLTLDIPALRERKDDLPGLLDVFLHQHARTLNCAIPDYNEGLLDSLSQYTWPGNVRQFNSAVLRALTEMKPQITLSDFQLPSDEKALNLKKIDSFEGTLDDMMSEFESEILQQLYQTYPSSRKLAKRLSMSHTAIANKLREYGINKSSK